MTKNKLLKKVKRKAKLKYQFKILMTRKIERKTVEFLNACVRTSQLIEGPHRIF